MLQHAVATFERREHNERESLELCALRRHPLRTRQACDAVRHIAIQQYDVAGPVREVEEAVRKEQAATPSARLPLAVHELARGVIWTATSVCTTATFFLFCRLLADGTSAVHV